ncbi:MAG: cytochrome c biogenesis protein CcsA [Saprospiraceae bacterium]|nr:cytochrome c biogenesis protein CcsA [Saprospiraceae bacterium]MBP8094606.1 cytochrome c biogenesis protein CcsA [Saprospiraceae bacterium]
MARLKENWKLNVWWKWLVIIFIPYVILMGFLIPLGQGIVKISPYNIKTGQSTSLTIEGYNTQFDSGDDIKAWIKHNDWHLQASAVEIINQQEAVLHFEVPPYIDNTLTNVDLALVMDTRQGPIVLPSAVNLNNAPAEMNGVIAWSKDKISVRPESNFNYPFRNILGETIRNTYFHVPLWFAMTVLFMLSVYYSIRHLRFKHQEDDLWAQSLVSIGILFGILGTITGSIWARSTWGSYWSFDVKQNMAAISLLIYGGYFLLRNSINDPDSKSRVGSIYNIFAFALLIPLIFIIPRRFDSLHPGNGGNPALGTQDLDNTMRMVFYPAVIAYIFLGYWLSQLRYRIILISNKLSDI